MTQVNSNAVAFHAGNMSHEYYVMATHHRPSSNPPQRKPYNHTITGQPSYSGAHSNLKNGPRPVNQDRRQYYCAHCKMAGHSTQRCYKIHGYPPGHKLYKGRKVAATAHNESTISSTVADFPS